jgi:hypothetical protein
MATEEQWRAVPSMPFLEASSFGRVRIKPYMAPLPNGGTRTYVGKPTYGCWAKKERRFIYLHKRHTFKVHFAVCEAFHGPRPFPEAIVMHEDENGANNQEGNLKWGTQEQNLNYPGFLQYCKTRTGENNPHVKGRKRGCGVALR